jgi:hypothetical protein
MDDESDAVFAGDERRELAYSVGKASGSVPLSGLFVRPVTWVYVNVMLEFIPIIFSAIGNRDLGERLAADNREVMRELMAGFRGEPSPSGVGDD